MRQHSVLRRSILAAGAGCAPSTPVPVVAADVITERVVPGKSVIWQAHAAAVEDAVKNGADMVMDFTAGNLSNPTLEVLKQEFS